MLVVSAANCAGDLRRNQRRPHNVNNDAGCVVGKTGGEVEKGTEFENRGGSGKKYGVLKFGGKDVGYSACQRITKCTSPSVYNENQNNSDYCQFDEGERSLFYHQ